MKKQTLSKPCAHCGKTIHKKITHSLKAWGRVKYCSLVCYWKSETPSPSNICPSCGRLFKPKFSSPEKSTYCSWTCRTNSQRKPLPHCELCGKPCNKHNRRFCSRACKIEWYRGKEVYNYAGGQAREHYASSFWMKLAEDIRVRDKVCQRCGKNPKPGTKLHVHHIHPWRFSKNDSPENLQALCPSCHKKADSELGL